MFDTIHLITEFISSHPELIILNLSYLLIGIAYLVRDMLWLRLIIMASELMSITYAVNVNNTTIITWNVIFFIINLIQVIIIIRERLSIKLPPHLEKYYNEIFFDMSKRRFLYFWSTGKEVKMPPGSYFCRKGEHQEELVLFLKGAAKVIIDGKVKDNISLGSFIAEISFITGKPASADVVSDTDVEFITWNMEKLHTLKQIDPQLYIIIQTILTRDMTVKFGRADTSKG